MDTNGYVTVSPRMRVNFHNVPDSVLLLLTDYTWIHIPENLSEAMEPANLLYCCNCSRRGHDSSTCHNYRRSQYFPTPAFVKNYPKGPKNKRKRNTANEDGISMSDRNTIKKIKSTRNTIIPEESDDIPNSSILYSYGTFKTSAHDGQILHKKLERDLNFKTDNFLKDEFPPLFLHELVKIAPFDLIIYRTQNKELFMRTRTYNGVAGQIQEIFIYWLKLNLEDKRSLKVYINIPHNAEELLNIFYIKWEEMIKTTDNPCSLANEIKSLKSTLTGISDPAILNTTTDKILHLRGKLLNMYNAKATQWPEMLRQITNRVRKSLRTKPKSFAFTHQLYLRCVHIYNEVYVPRTLTDKEMNVLIAKYNEKPKVVKKLNKKHDPYKMFLKSYQQNMIAIKQMNAEKLNPESRSTTSPNIIQSEIIPICAPTASITQEQNKNQDQSKMTATCTSTENISQEQNKTVAICKSTETISMTSNVQQNDNATRTDIGIPSGRCNVGDSRNTVSEGKAVYTTETVQLQHNNDISTNDKVENTINQVQHNSCTLIQSNDNNSEENGGTVKNNNAPATSSSQQEHTVIPETSVAKRKKRKRKRTSESNTEVSTDVSIECMAKKVINEALEFKLPYINKAVEEVKKRINDKNLKQEHIDVLQRLINLERDHQQYSARIESLQKIRKIDGYESNSI